MGQRWYPGAMSHDGGPVFERGVVPFSRTVTESDVELFADVTGDRAPMHVDAEYAARSEVGERIAHGALLLGWMSAAAARWCAEEGIAAVSYGYDRLRFIKPVRFGDTLTIRFTRLPEPGEGGGEADSGHKIFARVEACNQDDEVVAAAIHILWTIELRGTAEG